MAGTPPLFLTTTYFYLFVSTVITSVSRQFPITENLLGAVVFAVLSIGLLFIVKKMNPGPMKYVVYLVLLIALGQMFGPLDKKLANDDTIFNILVMVAGIFLAMTIVAFLDKGKDVSLGFGPYLFAGLIGLLVARIGTIIYVAGSGSIGKDLSEEFKSWEKGLSYFGLALFAGYTAYDTQNLKKLGERLGPKGKPDYINASLDLYIDILNLFVNVEDIVS